MTFYKKLPVLDAAEQAEFDKYLKEQYDRDIALARDMTESTADNHQSYRSDEEQQLAFQTILDKLATPRIYLLQDWLHRKAQEKAGVLSETGETAEVEKK